MKLRYPILGIPSIAAILAFATVKDSKVVAMDTWGNKTYEVVETKLIGGDTVSVQHCYDNTFDVCKKIK